MDVPSPITTVYLIRHGKTNDEDARRYCGRTDVPLSARGAAQITSLAERLKERVAKRREGTLPGLDAVFCSDLIRAVKSADIIAAAFDLQPVSSPQLGERNFGCWEGLAFDGIESLYPEEFRDWMKDPAGHRPSGGESAKDVRKRVMPCFSDLVRRHPGRQIAVVAHGGVNRIILCGVLHIPLNHLFRIEQDYAALNILEFRGGLPVVKAMNISPYLG